MPLFLEIRRLPRSRGMSALGGKWTFIRDNARVQSDFVSVSSARALRHKSLSTGRRFFGWATGPLSVAASHRLMGAAGVPLVRWFAGERGFRLAHPIQFATRDSARQNGISSRGVGVSRNNAFGSNARKFGKGANGYLNSGRSRVRLET